MTLDAVLFDLDNTLLLFHSEQEFFADYLRLVSASFSDHCPPDRFAHQLLASTAKMVLNSDPQRSNHEVFVSDFCPALGLDPESTMAAFDTFYRTEFSRLRRHTRPLPAARSVVESARRAGKIVVLATNPVFPEVAIRERLRWAELADVVFDFVTAYDHMSACKPQTAYYLEVSRRIGVQPERCLMVGNDPLDDLPAARVGMVTYLVDHGSWREDDGRIIPDYQGSLADVPRLWGAEVIVAG